MAITGRSARRQRRMRKQRKSISAAHRKRLRNGPIIAPTNMSCIRRCLAIQPEIFEMSLTRA